MPAKSTLRQRCQFGVEATYGTAVDGDYQFSQLMVSPVVVAPSEDISEQGGTGDVGIVLGKEQCNASFEGLLSISDLMVLLSSALRRPTVATNAKTYDIAQYADGDRVSLTVERGDSGGARKAAGLMVKDFSIEFGENTAPRISGNMEGKALATGATLTADPTRLPVMAVSPKNVSVSLATSLAGLSSGKLDNGDLLTCSLSAGPFFEPLYGIEDVTSLSDVVQSKPTIALAIGVQCNTAADTLLTALRAGTLYYARINMAFSTHTVEITMPCRLKDPGTSDIRGIYSDTYTLHANYDGPADSTHLGTMFKVVVTETLTDSGLIDEIDDAEE